MTKAPYLLPGARAGYRLGDQTVVDSMMHDGLTAPSTSAPWAWRPSATTERPGSRRERQDEFAAASHERAAAAIKDGRVREEIVGGERPAAQGRPGRRRHRRGRAARDHAESLAALGRRSTRRARSPPATPARSPTAAPPSSSCRRAKAATARRQAARRDRRLRPGRRPDASLLHQPSRAIRQALARRARGRRRRPVRDQRGVRRRRPRLDGRPRHLRGHGERNGGAIALGHPIGMSGTRLALTSATSCAGAAAGPARPRCAAVAARATPSWSARSAELGPRLG